MTTPMNNKTIKFSDDKISVLIRNCVVDRDQIKNIKDSHLILEDVPFGVAKNVLRHTHVDVQICKCKDIWEHVLCGDEDSLIKAYNAKVECEPETETKEEVVEEPVVLTQPEYVWDHDDQETTDTISDSSEDSTNDSEDNAADIAEALEANEDSTDEEDVDDSENESEDESDDEVESEEVVEQSQETSNYSTSNNGERVVRRQVNMNNHKKHRH